MFLNAKILVLSSLKVQKKKIQQNKVVSKYNNTLGINFTLNWGKISDLSYVAVKCDTSRYKKDIARDDLEKNFTTRNQLIDWLFSYD